MAEKKQTFEQSMERLEKLVGEMEGGALDLEQMIARFEEGQKLIKSCTKKLNEVEKKVEVLMKKGGELTTEPLDNPDSSAEAEDTPGELF